MTKTYATLLNRRVVIPSQKTPYMAVERTFFQTVMAPTIATIHLDEVWYLRHSPADRYAKVGFYEHRDALPDRSRRAIAHGK